MNINNANLLYYFPFNNDFTNYGPGGASTSQTGVSIDTTTTKLTSGSLRFADNTSRVELPSTTINAGGLTIAYWAKYDTIPTGDRRIVRFFGAGNGYLSIFLSSGGGGILRVSVQGDVFISTPVSISTEWCHYCITVSSSYNWKIYINGGTPLSFSLSQYVTGNYTNCNIGTDENTTIPSYMNSFVMFNREITELEVKTLAKYQNDVRFTSYPSSYPCFLEGSKILQFNPETQTEQYMPIETLRPGDLIKTSRSGYKAISHIGKKDLPDPATNPDIRDRLYVFDSKWASEDLGPLCLTGRHNLLHTKLSESEIELVKEQTGDIYVTENKYRVPAYLDARGKPYTKKDPVVIWHFALENDNKDQNYGVYANGLLVESSSIEYMTDHSNMELV